MLVTVLGVLANSCRSTQQLVVTAESRPPHTSLMVIAASTPPHEKTRYTDPRLLGLASRTSAASAALGRSLLGSTAALLVVTHSMRTARRRAPHMRSLKARGSIVSLTYEMVMASSATTRLPSR